VRAVLTKDRVRLRQHGWRVRSRLIPCWRSWGPTRKPRATPSNRLGLTTPRLAASEASSSNCCVLGCVHSATGSPNAAADGLTPSPPRRAV